MQTQTSTPHFIKTAMEALNTNQPGFAALVGVDQGTVSKWVNGKANPSGPVLKLVDKLLAEKRG